MSPLSIFLCCALCLSLSSALNSRLPQRTQRNNVAADAIVPVPVISAIESKTTTDCLLHPEDCLDSAISVVGSDFDSMVKNLEGAWNDIKNGLEDVEKQISTDYTNFQKDVSSEIQKQIIPAISGIITAVLKKIGSSLVNSFNAFNSEAQKLLNAQEQPIYDKLSSTWKTVTNTMSSIFNSKSTAADLKSEATSSTASAQASLESTTLKETATTDVLDTIENVAADTVSVSNIEAVIGKSVDLGIVFAGIDVTLLPLGYPITVYKDQSALKGGNTKQFVTDFVQYYEMALFNTFKSIVSGFLSEIVNMIAAAISATVMGAIDLATLGVGTLPAAGIAFVLDFVVSFFINMCLSAVISLTFQPIYTPLWNKQLEELVMDTANSLSSNAEALAKL